MYPDYPHMHANEPTKFNYSKKSGFYIIKLTRNEEGGGEVGVEDTARHE